MISSAAPIQLLRLGEVRYRQALRLMQLLAEARRRDEVGDTLLLVEHPPVITLGQAGGAEDLLATGDRLRRRGIEVVETERGGRATYHGPGQLVVYPILKLDNHDLHGYLWKLEQSVLDLLAEWGIEAHSEERHPGIWVGRDKIAAVGVAVQDRVTSHGIAINVDPDLAAFGLLVPCGIADRGVTSIAKVLGQGQSRSDEGCHADWNSEPLLHGRNAPDTVPANQTQGPVIEMADVKCRLVPIFGRVFGREVEPLSSPGPWLVAAAPGESCDGVAALLDELGLHTVCQEAACPNLGECWPRGAATFLILGNRCTRNCRFCNVGSGRPGPPDGDEPFGVAKAAERLGLSHVVVTSVTRDDLPDGGASHFAATIGAIRRRLPAATIEVLVPDLGGSPSAIEAVAGARPDIFGHNLETVARLSGPLRPAADYRRSLAVLAWARRLGMATKSGLMVGLGERCDEVIETMRDLRRAGCELLTIGQYLQPTPHQTEVAEFLPPALFQWYGEIAREMGFRWVASAPLVRSSYHAEEVLAQCR